MNDHAAEIVVVPDALSDQEIFRSAAVTLREVILPALRDDAEWARAATVHLLGLVRYAEQRGVDQSSVRVAELADVLDSLRDNPLVAAHWDGGRDQLCVRTAVGAILAAAVVDTSQAAAAVQEQLRPVVVRQLDDELANTAPLVAAFRGRLDE